VVALRGRARRRGPARPPAFDQYPPAADARPASVVTIQPGGVRAGAVAIDETRCEPGDRVESGYVLAGERARMVRVSGPGA
jgi:hypothetical protein